MNMDFPTAGWRSARPAALLLVEDDAVNQIVARGLLAGLGYVHVATAANGLEALQAFQRSHFDLVLMDCHMPEMDGLCATRMLRERGVVAPIVALTAGTTEGDRERCLAAGMDDYLSKPIDSQLLGRTLHKWLAGAAGGTLPMAAAFDPATLRERFFNEMALFTECRRIFLRQTPAWLDELQDCFAQGDHARARYLAHSAKGSAATIGAQRLAECCLGMEQALEPQGGGEADASAWLARARLALADFEQASAGLSAMAL